MIALARCREWKSQGLKTSCALCEAVPVYEEDFSGTTPQAGTYSDKGERLQDFRCIEPGCRTSVSKQGVRCPACAVKRRKQKKPPLPPSRCVVCGKTISRGSERCHAHFVEHRRKQNEAKKKRRAK